MGKSHFRAAVLFGPSTNRGRRCIACHRRIVWGDRCETCKRELVARRRHKPR